VNTLSWETTAPTPAIPTAGGRCPGRKLSARPGSLTGLHNIG
jgi:hypothetical protein